MPETRHVILAMDGGKVSGLAAFEPYARDFESLELPTWEAVGWIDTLLSHPRVEVEAVIVEKFVITARTLKLTRGENWTLEANGAVRYLCHEHGVPYFDYSAHDSKAFGTTNKLYRVGWLSPTEGGHRDDAARLILKYFADHDRLHLVGLA